MRSYKRCRDCHESARAGGIQKLIIRLSSLKKHFYFFSHYFSVRFILIIKHHLLRVPEKRIVSRTETTQFLVATGL